MSKIKNYYHDLMELQHLILTCLNPDCYDCGICEIDKDFPPMSLELFAKIYGVNQCK